MSLNTALRDNTTGSSVSFTLGTITFLQEYLKLLLDKTVEIQKNNMLCYKKLCYEKKISQLEHNPLVKLKLNQLFNCQGQDIRLRQSNSDKKKSLIKNNSELHFSGRGAFKKRSNPDLNSDLSSEVSSPDPKNKISTPSFKGRTSSNLDLEFNSKFKLEGLMQGDICSKKAVRIENDNIYHDKL